MLGHTGATDSKRRKCDAAVYGLDNSTKAENVSNVNQSYFSHFVRDTVADESQDIERIFEELKKIAEDSNDCVYEQLEPEEKAHVEIQEECIQNECRFLKSDQDGDTILHILIARDDKEGAILAIQKAPLGEAGIDIANNNGQTALHLATITGNLPIIQCLQQRKASIDICDCDENTPLHIACVQNCHERVYALLVDDDIFAKTHNQKCNINQLNSHGLAAFHIACQHRNNRMMEVLLKNGADVNVQHGPTGKTSLMMVLEEGLNDPLSKGEAIEFAMRLVNKFGADVNIRTYAHYTALHYACLLESPKMVQYLLDKDVDVGIKTSEKKTEKDLASSKEIKNLLEKKLRKKRRDRS